LFPENFAKNVSPKISHFFSHFVRSQKNAKILQKNFGKTKCENFAKKYGRESFFAQLIFQLQNIRFSQINFEKSIYVKFSIVWHFFSLFSFSQKNAKFREQVCEMRNENFRIFSRFLAKVFVRVNSICHCILFVLYDVIKQS